MNEKALGAAAALSLCRAVSRLTARCMEFGKEARKNSEKKHMLLNVDCKLRRISGARRRSLLFGLLRFSSFCFIRLAKPATAFPEQVQTSALSWRTSKSERRHEVVAVEHELYGRVRLSFLDGRPIAA
ncbi:hypothetical protein [Paraburkholderia sp. BL17N1]|uniref:hypothetical protein n=1 Tax=Paraburkholderia sp. BL17N1 TaxID=1938798 RepID=UPI0011C3600C|nr:hypothetical protein [Paraburkholderia sp. BL17N1]